MKPVLLAHADWSVSASKRWMAIAALETDGRYTVWAPEPAGTANTLLDRLWAKAHQAGCVLVGFDFPIGLPAAYAKLAGISSFLAFLVELGGAGWPEFTLPAGRPEQVSLRRPFYPARPGSARLKHLVAGLGLENASQLRRQCELARPGRRAAAPLFWTIGGQQVGKAALNGWQAVLAPALAGKGRLPYRLTVWPFSGHLSELLLRAGVIVAETYPAECYDHLGVQFSSPRPRQKSGKRCREDRARCGPALLTWADQAGVRLAPELAGMITDGFGPRPDGEDRFDAVVGLFGMLNMALGRRTIAEPSGAELRRIEGWILGQAVPEG